MEQVEGYPDRKSELEFRVGIANREFGTSVGMSS